jgi:hypothetical protein
MPSLNTPNLHLTRPQGSSPSGLRTANALASAALWLSAALAPAGAQTLKDPALETLYAADRPEALQRAATQRLASDAEDAQAVLAMALAAMQMGEGSARAQALAKALALAQECAEKQTRSSACHYAYGVILGVQAMSEGLLKAARSVGTVKQALLVAHEAEPAWYPARSALLEFYLVVPAFMGGSVSKATELARSAPKPEQAQALQARVLTQDKQLDAAVSAFAALPTLTDPALAADVLGWAEQAALGLVNAGQPAKAQPLFERLLRDHPGHAAGAYGMARVRGQLGDWAGALRWYERAAALKGAHEKPLAYRMGIAYQELGQTDKAKAALGAFVAAGKGQKASLDDARKRLAQLGG